MLTKNVSVPVERSGEFKESNFKIKASAKAFSILSSGLYSNKIRAIVRELGTNAADAQIDSGNSQGQFLVHLPNNLEPTFSLRDFGTGLSHDDITHIYTTYFESTKTGSNDFTGCLGLGSKSPFSYTDNFTVTSFFNGAKHVYSAFIGENGCPTIALMTTEETSEANGLEVSFGVKSADFYKFREEAEFVYKHFKVRPKIVGQEVKFSTDEEVYSGNDWKLVAGGKNLVVMGNVAYPLDLYAVEAHNSIFNRYAIQITVDIGEVEMTASRESLEYTKDTKEAVKKRVEECLSTFQKGMQDKLDTMPTLWDATKFYANNSAFIGNCVWQGQQLSTTIKLAKSYPCTRVNREWSDRLKVKKNREVNRVEPNIDGVAYCVNDVRGAIERVKAWMKTPAANDVKTVSVINFADGEQKEFEDAVGTMPQGMFILASTLPKIVRTYVKGGSVAASLLEFVPGRSKAMDSWNGTEEIDIEEGGVYVELDHWTPGDFGTHTHLSDILELLNNLGYPVELVGVRKKVLTKVKANTEWKPLKDYMLEVVKKFEKDYEFAVSSYSYQEHTKLLKLKKHLVGLPIDNLLTRIMYVEKNMKRLRNLSRLLLLTNLNNNVKIVDVNAEVEVLTSKYPLLFFMLSNVSNYIELPGKDIADYIRSIDAKSVNAEVF